MLTNSESMTEFRFDRLDRTQILTRFEKKFHHSKSIAVLFSPKFIFKLSRCGEETSPYPMPRPKNCQTTMIFNRKRKHSLYQKYMEQFTFRQPKRFIQKITSSNSRHRSIRSVPDQQCIINVTISCNFDYIPESESEGITERADFKFVKL